MQSLTSTQLAWLQRGGKLGYYIDVTPVSGVSFVLTGDDILEGSFTIDRSNWTYSDNIEIGCADAAEISFELDNFDGRFNTRKFEGAYLDVFYDIHGELLHAGKFVIDNRPRRLYTLSVKGLDYMALFNKAYDTTLAYPATLMEILSDCCTNCGVTMKSGLTFTNQTHSVTSKPSEADMTYHQVVAWIAELAGCNAWMNEDGELVLSWYGENQLGLQMVFTKSDYFDIERSEDDVRITGVEFNDANSTNYIVGTSDYSIVIDDNPLFQTDYTNVLTNIYNKVRVHTWQPMPSLDSLNYPHLWPGDFVYVEADDLIEAGETLAEISPTTLGDGASIAVVTNGDGVLGGKFAPYNSARLGMLRLNPTTDSTRYPDTALYPSATLIPRSGTIFEISNPEGVVSATLSPYLTLRFGALVSKCTLTTRTVLESAGESETSSGYATISPLTAQQRRIIKTMTAN